MENKEQAEAVANCKDFLELRKVISKYEPFVSYSRAEPVEWRAVDLKERLIMVMYGAPLNLITRASGLRDKVKQLMEEDDTRKFPS